MKTPYEYRKDFKENNYKAYKKGKKRYETKYPDRYKFTKKVCVLKEKGIVKPSPCRICGSIKHLQACTLSPDINDPVYLCYQCNRDVHKDVTLFPGGKVNLI